MLFVPLYLCGISLLARFRCIIFPLDGSAHSECARFAPRENMAYHGELSRTLTNQLKINGCDMISVALKASGYEFRTHKKCIA